MTAAQDFQVSVHNRMLDLRVIDSLTHREDFMQKFARLDDEEIKALTAAAESADAAKFKKILRVSDTIVLEEMTVTALRKMAGRLGIKMYTLFSKNNLINLIKEVQGGGDSKSIR